MSDDKQPSTSGRPSTVELVRGTLSQLIEELAAAAIRGIAGVAYFATIVMQPKGASEWKINRSSLPFIGDLRQSGKAHVLTDITYKLIGDDESRRQWADYQ